MGRQKEPRSFGREEIGEVLIYYFKMSKGNSNI